MATVLLCKSPGYNYGYHIRKYKSPRFRHLHLSNCVWNVGHCSLLYAYYGALRKDIIECFYREIGNMREKKKKKKKVD